MRRWLGIGGAVVLGLVAALVIAWLVYFDRIGERVVRGEIVPALEARLGRQVHVGAIDVGIRAVVLEAVEVAGPRPGAPLAAIERVRVEYGLGAALRRAPEVSLVSLEGVRVRLRLGGDGGGDAELLSRLRGGGSAGGRGEASGASGSLRPDRLIVDGASMTVRDEDRGITLSVRGIEGEIDKEGAARATIGHVGLAARALPTGSASDLRVSADVRDPLGTAELAIGDGRVSVSRGIALTGIRGELASGGAGRLDIDLSGSYGGATERLWSARGWIDPRARTGDLAIDAERFALDRIAHVLTKTPIRKPEETKIGASLRIEVGTDVASFRGDLEVAGLTVAHPMLATKPVAGVDVSARVRGEIDRQRRALEIEDAEIEVGGVRYGLEAFAFMPGGVDPDTGAVREALRAGGRVVVEPVDCQAVLSSIPEALVPRLQGFELEGEFSADLHVDVDLEDLEETELGGEMAIHGCRVVSAPRRVTAKRLGASFPHRVQLADDEWLRLVLGPEDPDFVPLEEVSPHLVNSLMTTEDSGFYSHDGFVRRQFGAALRKNLEAGYFRYGASSITMQMVKNVLLARDKTLSRKLQELVLTWYVETELDKDRIMEIYVNAIEFGPGIYGIGRAARHYFGKRASELNPVEAAFFSSILPNPKGRYRQFCRGELSEWTAEKIERILDLMYERERLTAMEHQIALSTPLFFDRSHVASERACLQDVARAIANAPSTTPTLDDDTGEVAAR